MNEKRPIMSRTLALVFLAVLAGDTGFYLLLSPVSLYTAGVAGSGAAGLATGALMLATVAGELATARLTARFGYRLVLGAGLLLLGAPPLALAFPAALPVIVAVCLVRGLGFAMTVVAGGALVAELVPADRRGEGFGLFGVVVGVPSIVALPAGVWLAAHLGYPPVFAAGAVLTLAGIAAVRGLPHGQARPSGEAAGLLRGMREPGLLRPALMFAATALAAGAVITFLPLALPRAGAGFAALALLAQSVTATAARWWAGRHGDRHGPAALLAPGTVLAVAGLLTAAWTGSPVAVLAGMALFGTGFGIAQNASLASMFGRAGGPAYGAVSALWNLAYDAGFGAGAAGCGVLAARLGYPAAFALTAVVMVATLPLARGATGRRRARRPGPARHPGQAPHPPSAAAPVTAADAAVPAGAPAA